MSIILSPLPEPETRLHVLPNGLRVVLQPMPHLATISVGLWVNVGARSEPAALNGISHLLEHMAFKGTPSRSARQIAEAIEDVGGHLNAYTSRESTAYYCKLLASDAPLALDIIADITLNPTFIADELERERGVILQEIGQALDTPDDIIFDYFQEVMFPNQALGRSILGQPDIIQKLGAEDLRHYLGNYYRAGAMVLVAVGNMDEAAILAQAEQLFSAVPAGMPPTPDSARYHGGEDRRQDSLEQVHLLYGMPAFGYHHPDYYALQAYATLLGGGMSSRLFQEVREKRGLAYSIYAYANSYQDAGLFGVYAGTGEAEAAELLPVIQGEIDNSYHRISSEELQRAKAQLRTGLLMSLESTMGRAEQLASQLLIFNRVQPLSELLEKIEAVDIAALRRVIDHLRAGPPALAALGPIGKLPALAA